jgi:putative hydrolase of HD superfamily
MEHINKLREFYRLKTIDRACSVRGRKESAAEHSWSCLILADYFLTIMDDPTLNRLRIYELLMYHDVVEIESGDINLLNEEERTQKEQLERHAMHQLKKKIPPALRKKFVDLFHEYEEQQTREARFAKAIDALDAEIHELDYKEDCKGWTEEFLRRKKGPLFKEFPLLNEAFEKTTTYARDHGYFDQR